MLPCLALRDAAADFTGGMVIKLSRDWQGPNPRPQVRRSRKRSLPSRHQKPEFIQHLFHRVRRAIVPVENALRRIAPAQKMNLSLRPRAAQLACDIDQQTTLGYGYLVSVFRALKHFKPFLERGALKGLVRISARHHADGLIRHAEARIHQGQMRSGERIKRACKNSDCA